MGSLAFEETGRPLPDGRGSVKRGMRLEEKTARFALAARKDAVAALKRSGRGFEVFVG